MYIVKCIICNYNCAVNGNGYIGDRFNWLGKYIIFIIIRYKYSILKLI